MSDVEDLAEKLAELGNHLDAAGWRDFLTSPSEVQDRILATMQAAAVRPGPDYWGAVADVLKGAVGIAGAVSGVGSAIGAVQALAKL